MLKENFKDSIVVRLHGDEFAVVTSKPLKHIDLLFDLCDEIITLSNETGTIPEPFNYNAGIVDAEHSIAKTKAKADYMMYYAKKNGKRSQVFDEEIWKQKSEEDNFADLIDDAIKFGDFSYIQKDLFKQNKEKTSIETISTRGKDFNRIFEGEKYDFLRNNSQLKKIDLYNLQNLLYRINFDDKNRMIIYFDYKSLLSKVETIRYLRLLVDSVNLSPNKIIISINVNDVDSRCIDKVINLINEIKEIGFSVCLDKYSSKTGDHIYENTDIDFVKLDPSYWKNGINNPKIDYSLRKKIEMFTNYQSSSIPILTSIEKEPEYIYASGLSDEILLGGSYLGEEKKMILKKD
jgi:predicted signal transduction protein with EAL and GGDEF domain